MAAGFVALGHHRNDPGRLRRLRFSQARGRRNEHAAGAAQRRQAIGAWKAKMEADHWRFQLNQGGEHRIIVDEAGVGRLQARRG